MVSSASAETRSMRVRFEQSMMMRGDSRSVSAPPTSMNTARGMATSASTVPMAKALPVSLRTSHGRAMR